MRGREWGGRKKRLRREPRALIEQAPNSATLPADKEKHLGNFVHLGWVVLIGYHWPAGEGEVRL